MGKRIENCVVRASLDDILLPPKVDKINFLGFVINKSPNYSLERKRIAEDGSIEQVTDYPTEEEYVAGFPKSEYYLEIDVGEIEIFDFDKAHEEVNWALNRLRLFKPGLLWGSLWGIFPKKDLSIGTGIYEFKRTQEEGPYTSLNYVSEFANIFKIEENEIIPLVDFVNDYKNAPKELWDTAFRRFNIYFDRELLNDRALDLMIALESIFSDDNDAISYKIALRTSYLAESNGDKRLEIYNFVKQAYKTRSKIVHGSREDNWLSENSFIPRLKNIDALEEIVRRCLNILIKMSKRGIILKASNLDKYLFFNIESR